MTSEQRCFSPNQETLFSFNLKERIVEARSLPTLVNSPYPYQYRTTTFSEVLLSLVLSGTKLGYLPVRLWNNFLVDFTVWMDFLGMVYFV